MPKFRKSRKRKNNPIRSRNRPSPQRNGNSIHSSGTASQTAGNRPEEDEKWLSDTWDDTRSGATSSRGYHFQDAVGAWLAARLASGNLAPTRLIPEGFDDLLLEGQEPVHYEVKSRQNRLGPFSVHKAIELLVNAWICHKKRFGNGRQLVVVLEQGIKGLELDKKQPISEMPIRWLFERIIGIKERLTTRLEKQGVPSGDIDFLTSVMSVVVCSWTDLDSETARYISNVVDLPPAALPRLTIELRSKVADTVDKNAEAQFNERASLDRTFLIKAIRDTAELFDLESLEYALNSGICTPVDKQPIDAGDGFYEGVSTQPGHVSAGLVVPRPDLVQHIGEGLELHRPVLLTGPSGVGKSATLWMLPYAFPGILWFRAHRIAKDDIPYVARLLRAYGASPESPVGLLVDTAGRDEFEAWEMLQQAVMSTPGALLVGAARNEDIFSLGDLADCHIVKISLNNRSAAAIHAGLIRRGATEVQHWREAFEQSNGLTLEFTHLLTQGIRLQKVLKDQISQRIQQKRTLELYILAVVATADCWSASIQYSKLERYLQVSSSQIRMALERLVEEHLLVNQNGVLRGTHQIRSRGIVEVIHRNPPPQLVNSVKSVIGLLSANALSRFVFEVLRDCPSLETQVLEFLEEIAFNNEDYLVATLRGLELLDFYRQASAWVDVLKSHKLPTAHQPLALFYVIAELDIPSFFPKEFRDAIQANMDLPGTDATRDKLLERIGLEKVATLLASADSAYTVQRLLRAMRRTSIDWKPLLASLESGTSLVRFLNTCRFVDLGECVSAAHSVSPLFAGAWVNAIGGSGAVLKRARSDDPWIRELKIDLRNGEAVGVARFLYVAETVHGEADKRAIELGRQLLRALPEINKVDVRPVRPNGSFLEVNGHEYATSGLSRPYDYHPEDIDWNRSRSRLAQTLIGASETERLFKIASLLPEVAKLVRDFGNAFVLSPSWSRIQNRAPVWEVAKAPRFLGYPRQVVTPLIEFRSRCRYGILPSE